MLVDDPDRLCVTVRCADRFGDYGLIGFLMADLQRGEITDFFMSCRVQRKRVEHALFAWIAREAAARGHGVLGVQFKASARNAAARAMLEDLGFAPDADETLWTRDAKRPFDDAGVVQIRTSLRAEAA
jgi:predicted enzyme involved in methoxymalonyl-ACP biosynthesis